MLFHNYIKDRTNRIANDVACPHWSQTEGCYREYEAANGETLVPCGICKGEIEWVCHILEENFAHYAEDVDRCHHY